MGGTISYDLDGAAESAADLTADDYAQLREDVRNALYQEVPGFESIQTILRISNASVRSPPGTGG